MLVGLYLFIISLFGRLLQFFAEKIINYISDKSTEQQLKEDVNRLNKAAVQLNSPSTFVQYSKVKREIDAKIKKIEALQAQRKQNRIVTYTHSACIFLKYFLPIIPVMLWWNTPILVIPNPTSSTAEPIVVGVVWWAIICDAATNRLVQLIS